MNKYRRQIAKIDDKIKELQDKKQFLQVEMMVSCSHPFNELVEASYGAHYSNSQPYNLCKLCGYAEDAWRTPVHLEHAYCKNLPRVDGKTAYEYRTRHYSNEDMDAMNMPERDCYKEKANDPWIKPFLKPWKNYVK